MKTTLLPSTSKARIKHTSEDEGTSAPLKAQAEEKISIKRSVEQEAAEIVAKGSEAVAQQGGPPKTFDAGAGGVANGVLGFRAGGAKALADVGERASRAAAMIDAARASGNDVTGANMSMQWFEKDWSKRGATPIEALQGSLRNVFMGVLDALTSAGPRPLTFSDDLAPHDAQTPMWLAEMRQRTGEVVSFVEDAKARGVSVPAAEHSLLMLESNLQHPNPKSGESFFHELELNLLENLAKDLLAK